MITDDRQRPKMVPISAIRWEEGGEELLKSPEAQPYMRLAKAVVAGRDAKPALQIAVATVPHLISWASASSSKPMLPR